MYQLGVRVTIWPVSHVAPYKGHMQVHCASINMVFLKFYMCGPTHKLLKNQNHSSDQLIF